jgi:glycosyltransferase involved in cell wall biosynthesis
LRYAKSVCIKNGFDDELFYYDESINKENRATSIIAIGRLHPVKGYDILLEALTELQDFTLTIIGEGKMRQEYQAYIEVHSLHDRVTLLGEIQPQDMRNHLMKADIFCLPSRSEGFPATPLEAMACGLPVVCTNVGGMPEIVVEGENGFLCEPENSASLAEAILKASNTTWNHESIARWAKERFSWDRWAKDIMILCKENDAAKS